MADDTIRMRLTAIRWASPGIHSYEFRPVSGAPLPEHTAGAHVDLHLGNGMVRQYSLLNAPGERHRYVVGIKRDAQSRGGSRYIHDSLPVGTVLDVSLPRNHFPLHEDAAESVFVAGGIGITPIACMIGRLQSLGRPWRLHYAVRRREEAAFIDELDPAHVQLHVDEEHGGRPMDVAAATASASPHAHLYCCGPGPMLDAFEQAMAGRPEGHWHVERFTAAHESATGGGYTVRLAKRQREVKVLPGETILDALRKVGIEVQASCEQGVCGTCETRVISGVPDHRDSLLSDEEKKTNTVMMVCCSGSLSSELVLDL